MKIHSADCGGFGLSFDNANLTWFWCDLCPVSVTGKHGQTVQIASVLIFKPFRAEKNYKVNLHIYNCSVAFILISLGPLLLQLLLTLICSGCCSSAGCHTLFRRNPKFAVPRPGPPPSWWVLDPIPSKGRSLKKGERSRPDCLNMAQWLCCYTGATCENALWNCSNTQKDLN